MKRTLYLLLIYFPILAGLAANCDAGVVGGIAEIAIIDRDSGIALNSHFYHGEYWVAGRPGARYAIEIRNRLSERLLAVTSVDGVNAISGATAGWNQDGYVFDSGERYQITGWRKSDVEVAAFTFTDSPHSYAQRTGRPANVGVIGVALFRERQPQPIYPLPQIGQLSDLSESQAARSAESAPPTAQARASDSNSSSVARKAAAPKLGTGHGEREFSSVAHTEFLRMQDHPNELMRIHYDSFDNLVAMGIVRRPPSDPATPNPFPASPESQYVADPPR